MRKLHPSNGKSRRQHVSQKARRTQNDLRTRGHSHWRAMQRNFFERILINRVAEVLPFTEAQAGARKGRSTAGQAFILKTILHMRVSEKQPTYLAFLDVKKAYDKVWKAAVLVTLWERGIRGKMWRLLRLLNIGLVTKVATRFGLTKEVHIEESLRQGGVASGIEFAALMDTAEEELQKEELGVYMGGVLVSSLILMDDIILIAPSPEVLQSMLNTINRLAMRWHLTFSQEKSKIMIVNGPSATRPERQWTLGSLVLEECSQYTYLGEVIDRNLSIKQHLTHLKSRSFVVSTTMFGIATDDILNKMKLPTLLQLYQTCWVQAILYNSETWTLQQSEISQIQQMQLSLLRRILKIPKSAPRAAIFSDLGVQPIMYSIHTRQLMFLHKLICADDLPSHALRHQIDNNKPGSWFVMSIQPILRRYKLPESMWKIQGIPKPRWKRMVSRAVFSHFEKWYTEEASKSTKMINVLRHKTTPVREKYVETLSRNQAAAIFRIRYGVTLQQANMGTTAPICSRCKDGVATDSHALTRCPALEELRDGLELGSMQDIYGASDMDLLKRCADFAYKAGMVPEWIADGLVAAQDKLPE